jgi:hypothetical protein
MDMKQILLEIDDRCARDLERVAPAGKRVRAEFIRLAVRHAIDLALDRTTELAYRKKPLPAGVTAADLEGWDPGNLLAKPAVSRMVGPRPHRSPRRRRRGSPKKKRRAA